MSTDTQQNPGLGHNHPNASVAMQDRADQLAETCNAWLANVNEIETEEQAMKADDFNELIKAEQKEVEKERKAEKRPHLDANKAIDETYNPIKAKLETIKNLFAPLRTKWLQKLETERREKERKANDEAMRKLQEAEDAKKAAEEAARSEAPADVVGTTIEAEDAKKAADQAVEDANKITQSTVGVKGHYGSRKSSLRTTYHAVITDYDKALDHLRDHPKMTDLVQELADAWARSPELRKKTIPGVELKSAQKAA